MHTHTLKEFDPIVLESIKKQSYRNWELIVIDDHSTDGSWELLQKYAKKDRRIRTYRNRRNCGVSYTANKAIKLAKSQFIARMDSDDIAAPKRLAVQIEYLLKHSKVIAVGGQCDVINEQNQVIGHKRFPTQPSHVSRMLFSFASIQQPTMMVNTALLPKKFHWYEDGLATAEEHELLFRLLQHGQLANLPNKLLSYRMHAKNISSRHPKKDFWAIARARWNAVFIHGYRPNLRGLLTTLAQASLVITLPESLLYQLYTKLRGWSAPVPLPVEALAGTKLKEINRLRSLSVFFPMHNEEENIARVLAQAQKVVPQLAEKYEIIVVNDGSRDRTSEIAHRLAKKDRHIVVVDQVNLGYGGALQTGFRTAKYDWVFFADGDLQFDLGELAKFVPLTAQNMAVLGYRIKRADKWSRLLLAKMLKIWNIVFFQFPAGIKDIDCAFKLFHRSVVEDVMPLQSRGAMISTELLLKLVDNDYAFDQVGVTHYPRHYGAQTGARWNVIYGAVKETVQLLRSRRMSAQAVATSADARVAA
jgi:glycosyltransferase involved in cell wall biosynthesis